MIQTQDNNIEAGSIEHKMAIEQKLLGNLLYKISNAEWKGLTLLSEAVAASEACIIDEDGVITANHPEADICLDVRKTIFQDDGHIHCWASSTASGVKVRQRACVAANEAYGRIPATDNCFAFVLWADSGFARMPLTLRDAILYCQDPEEAERKKAEKTRRCDLMRKIFREQKLKRDAEIREAELLKTLRNDERIRLGHMGWRELMTEQRADEGGDSLSELFARDFRSAMLRGEVMQ